MGWADNEPALPVLLFMEVLQPRLEDLHEAHCFGSSRESSSTSSSRALRSAGVMAGGGSSSRLDGGPLDSEVSGPSASPVEGEGPLSAGGSPATHDPGPDG